MLTLLHKFTKLAENMTLFVVLVPFMKLTPEDFQSHNDTLRN